MTNYFENDSVAMALTMQVHFDRVPHHCHKGCENGERPPPGGTHCDRARQEGLQSAVEIVVAVQGLVVSEGHHHEGHVEEQNRESQVEEHATWPLSIGRDQEEDKNAHHQKRKADPRGDHHGEIDGQTVIQVRVRGETWDLAGGLVFVIGVELEILGTGEQKLIGSVRRHTALDRKRPEWRRDREHTLIVGPDWQTSCRIGCITRRE
mmetsp:Transcript_34818/g.87587  ORF Transcript_34818/g.87587 Transcript_34818/m.87587 type:complete len:207 (-) Transcript_34818:547-1167(-)